MPVLDAKALENDPKGLAFLMSVLRQTPTPKPRLKELPRIRRIRFHMIRRLGEFIAGTA